MIFFFNKKEKEREWKENGKPGHGIRLLFNDGVSKVDLYCIMFFLLKSKSISNLFLTFYSTPTNFLYFILKMNIPIILFFTYNY